MGDAASLVVVASVDHGTHERLAIAIPPQVQIVEVIGEGSGGIVAVAEISQLGIDDGGIKGPGLGPCVHSGADIPGIPLRAENPVLEQAPQQREVRNGALFVA